MMGIMLSAVLPDCATVNYRIRRLHILLVCATCAFLMGAPDRVLPMCCANLLCRR